MSKSTKIGRQRLKVGEQAADAVKAKQARIAKETRSFNKSKQDKEDAQLVGLRIARRPDPKKK